MFLVLGQLCLYGYFLYGFAYNSSVALAVQMVTGVLSVLCVLYLINRTDKPSTRVNWIIFILVFPLVGAPMYLLYGDARSNRKLKRKIACATRENKKGYLEVYGERKPTEPKTRADGIERYMFAVTGYPAFTNGDVCYYESGEKMFPDMLEALKKAKRFILVEYFIIEHGKMWDEILKILLEKAEEGVQVRVLYDDFGCMLNLPPKYDRYLETLNPNVRAVSFNKVVPIFTVKMNNRDHRKILVVDGKVAFTGGVNLADEYINKKTRFGYWKDTGIKVTGDAVSSFTLQFFNLFNAVRDDKEDIKAYLLPPTNDTREDVKILPYDDSPLDAISVGETVYLDLIHRAEKFVYIFTPYLVLDDSMREALCLASLRGVDVRIVTPGIPDKKMIYRLTRANYGLLMQAGVKIYEYTPGFIHAKSMLCDGESAVVGTINLDYRSLYLHFENAVYFTRVDAVKALEKDCEKTFIESKLCTKEDVKRGLVGRVVDSVLRVFETLL